MGFMEYERSSVSGVFGGRWDAVFYAVIITLLLSLFLIERARGNDVMAISPSGDVVATASDGGRIELRPISAGNGLVTIQHEGVPSGEQREMSAISWMPGFVFSPDGSVVASVCGVLPVTLWDVKTGERLKEFANVGVGCSLRFSNDGSRLIGFGIVNKTGLQQLTLWNVNSGDVIRQLTVDKSIADQNWDRHNIRPRFAKTGPMLVIEVISGAERSLNVWNTASNKQVFVVECHRVYPADWVISPDGIHLILREYTPDGEGVKRHRVFEMATGNIIKEWTPVVAKED
jgi:WD40 repeat protein